MQYPHKIKYNRYNVSQKDSFAERVDEVLMQLRDDEAVLRLSFFAGVNSQESFIENKEIITKTVRAKFGINMPALNFVAQTSLSSPLILEVHTFTPDPDDMISYRSINHLPYVLLENKTGRFLFAGGFQGDPLLESIQQQSSIVFKQISALLQKENFAIHEIVRQWNYIEQITKYENGNQHYQQFNNARSSFYHQTAWPHGYPAATGIGTSLGGISIDLDAVSFKTKEGYVTAIDNKLQVAAHAYSDKVLEDANNQKTTPKFERAKSVTIGNSSLIYVSGTAAIRGENSLNGVGLEKQLQITMENIAELIGDANLALLRVYLKNAEDYARTATLLGNYPFSVPVSYMIADVCRDELLIEIEGIAKK